MTSCHDDFGSEPQGASSAIEFGLVEESENTRGTPTDETLLQTKGYILWAAKNSDTSFDPATDKVDFLFEEPVSYSSGAWQYENRKFWPQSGALSFFAVGPADQFGVNLNTEHEDTDAGAPILTYEVPVTLEDQADIVIAQVPNRSNDGTTVDFDFEHMLSRIDFKVMRPNQPDTKVYLRKFEIYYKNNTISRKCDINLNDKTIAIAADDAPFTSGSSADVLAGTVYNDAEKALDLTAISLDDNLDKSLFVVPQNYTEGDLYVKLSYTAKTDDGTIKETVDDKIVNLPLGTATLEKGKNYTYTLSIGCAVATGITYDAATKTYHVTSAEGLDVLNKIYRSVNTQKVAGLSSVPNGYTSRNISIDADIDMADLGSEYNWTPFVLKGNFTGNGFEISNLKCEVDENAGFFSSTSGTSTSLITIKDLVLRNPSIKSISGYAAGISYYSFYAILRNCQVIQDDFADPTVFAISSSTRGGAGLVSYYDKTTALNCYVQANISGSSAYGLTYTTSDRKYDCIGCYVKSNKITSSNRDRLCNYTSIDSQRLLRRVLGCAIVYGDSGVSYDYTTGFSNTGFVSVSSFGGQDYSWIESAKLAAMNNQILSACLDNNLGTPDKLFSLTPNTLELVDYTTALADESMTYATSANGITYNSATHTYHVSTAEGLDVFNRISRSVNIKKVTGCSYIPNGKSVDGTTNDNISIDADIDMADLGDTYNWTPFELFGNLDGNEHSISNLRCHFTSSLPSAFINETYGTSDSRLAVKNLTLLNPSVYSSDSGVAGFAWKARYTDFERCYVIDEDYTDVNHVTIQGDGMTAGFVAYTYSQNTYLYCGVQASLKDTYRSSRVHPFSARSGSSGGTSFFEFVGCYANTSAFQLEDENAAKTFGGPSTIYGSALGCALIAPDASFTLPADHLYGSSYKDDHKSIVNSYLVADYATLKSNNYIHNMNTAIEQYYTDKGLGTPAYLYSLQSDDFKLVPYGSSELVPLPAITYDAATHTYHITEAEGLDILNKIFQGVNTEAVSGCATIPNGNKFNGSDYDNVSIDADLDMADMGDTYQWTPMDLPACELKGNNFEIANLKCVVDGVGEVASFIDNASGTTIRDLTIRNPLFQSSGSSSRAAGFANVILGTLIERCRVIQDDYTTSSSYAIKNTNGDGAAGFVCRAHTQSMIINCVTNVNVNFANTVGKRTTGFGPYIINTGDEATIVASYCKSASINTNAESYGLFANGATYNTNSIKVVGCLMYYPDVMSEKFSSGLKVEFVNSGTLMNFSHVPMFFGSYADINTSIQQWHAAEGLSTPPYIYDSTVTDDFVLIPNP